MVWSKYFRCLSSFLIVVVLSSHSLFASGGINKADNFNQFFNILVDHSAESLDVCYDVLDVTDVTDVQNENMPSVDVDNLDKFPAKDHLTFSRIQIPWQDNSGTGPYNENHDSVTVRITNHGVEPLRIDNLTISNSNYFVIDKVEGATSSLAFPINLNTRQYIDVTVKFIAVNPGDWKLIKILHETLTIVSNDPKSPNKPVYLHGLWQLRGEDRYEPSAQDMLEAFGFKTRTGWIGMRDPDKGDTEKLKGDEVFSPYFVRADVNKPVQVIQMGAYHGCCNNIEILRYIKKGTKEGRKEIFRHRKEDGQSLLPRLVNSEKIAEKSFNPEVGYEVFGFNVGNDYTDPALNTYPAPYDIDNNKIGIRVWKVLDAQGNVIPNSFIIANDYLGGPWTNYDYNDNMYFVSNIKPELGTAHYSVLSPSPSALDFGQKETGTTNNLTVDLSSLGKTYGNGTADPVINISKVEVVGLHKSEFTASNPAATNLNPQASTNLTVEFKPTASGFKTADLLIHYNIGDSPLRVPLYAIATDDCKEVTEQLRIKSGSDANVTSGGKTWISDKPYRKGDIRLDVPPAHVNQIAGTDDDEVYIKYLSSNIDHKVISYEFPVPNGEYLVRLHFSENYWKKPGERVFTISMENEVKEANFDILKNVKPQTALVKNYSVSVNDEILNMDFTPTVNRLSLAAVEIYKVNSGAGILLSTAVTHTTCDEDNGTITATAGNSQQISYKLGESGTYQSSGVFENLAAGTYTVFAKAGSEDCEATTQVVVEDGGCQNAPPIVNNPINDQAAKEGAAFNFTFPANTFNDPDQNDFLTYKATLANTSALPSWLSFSPESRSFSGTPGSGDVGLIEVEVTATDKRGATVSDYFMIVITGKDDPFIEEIDGITIQQDSQVGPISFTISAGDYSIDDLKISAISDNDELLPDANIVLEGSGTERSFTITPAAGKTGSAIVTVILKAANKEITRSFTVTVLKNNDFPTISRIEDITIEKNSSAGPLAFSLADEDGEENDLIITGTSDNQSLIPDGSIFFGGTDKDRTVTVTPLEDQTGKAKITIQVFDGESMAETSFTVTVSNITSIDTEKLESQIKLYPNPAQNNITIKLENDLMGSAHLFLMDTKGKTIRSFTFVKNSNTVEYEFGVESLTSGTYIIKVQQKDSVSFRKFIKY